MGEQTAEESRDVYRDICKLFWLNVISGTEEFNDISGFYIIDIIMKVVKFLTDKINIEQRRNRSTNLTKQLYDFKPYSFN